MSEHEGLRVPPHSLEAEQSVLGGLLLDNRAWDIAGAMLEERDFYTRDHGVIWAAIGTLITACKPADIITVNDQIARASPKVDFGGMMYLNALATSVPSAANMRRYAEIVRERASQRRLIGAASELLEQAWRIQPHEVGDVIDRSITKLLGFQQAQQKAEPELLDALMPPFIDALQELAEGKNPAVETGFADLDRLTAGGGRPGELWVIGARPSMGKTALVLNLSRTVGEQHGVLVLTQEDSKNSQVARFVAMAGRINLSRVRRPKTEDSEAWASIAEGVDALRTLRVSLDDQAGLTLADVRRKVQQVKRREPDLKLVIVDYLQLMEGDGDNRNQMLGQVANGLKRSAKELGVWIVLLSQLNREADKRSGPPQMADLRDSGDIEGAADVIGLLHREWRRKPTEENKHWAQLHVAKNKNGPTDTISLYFDGETQRFGNWEGPAPLRGRGVE